MSAARDVRFDALEYDRDTTLRPAAYRITGSPDAGWRVERDGATHLRLGPGYALLRTARCGICSTDLDRHFLPFPLPQVTGHELIATDETGGSFVVEINASHLALGDVGGCAFCRLGLDHHCPDRRVLGIHDLPGGFGPFVLAPLGAMRAIPEVVTEDAAILVEPFAAALNAVRRIAPAEGDVIGVLGPRRLGLLVIAALSAWRRRTGHRFRILGLARRAALRDLALRFGADEAPTLPGRDPYSEAIADVVVDTTASPQGFADALGLAAREVHLKSTHGRESAGLEHLTELVVDEVSLAALNDERLGDPVRHGEANAPPTVLWLAGAPPPPPADAYVLIVEPDPALALERLETGGGPLPRADRVVVDTAEQIDRALRPIDDDERALVAPEGEILLHRDAASTAAAAPLFDAILARGLRVSSSRCGDFDQALALLREDAILAASLPDLITHRFPAWRLEEAMRTARTPGCIKAIVEHPPAPRHEAW